MRLRARNLLALAAAACVALGVVSCRPTPEVPPANHNVQGGLDVTFLVTADLHFGASAMDLSPSGQRTDKWVPVEPLHRVIIDQMNGMAGKAYPPKIGGKVGSPVGLLAAGDLTEDGKEEQWKEFEKFYGLTGKDGLLRMPVYEGFGNHDTHAGAYVRDQIARRRQANYYAWDWNDLRVMCLADGPDDQGLAWLARALEATGKQRPVVLYLHYPMAGPYVLGYWFGDGNYRERLAKALAGYNIVAIFHGHFHHSGHYKWRGFDVYNVGSVKHGSKSFAVVHVTDGRLTVCSWNYEAGGWWWWHSKPTGAKAAATQPEFLEIGPPPGFIRRPAIPYPMRDTKGS